jgi:formate-dependent nitrite reductase membrane component NrfD
MAAIVSGIFGLGLAGYTGVLVAHTTVPVWQRPHRLMPALFLSSGVTGAASLFDLLGGNPMEQRAALLFGTAGKIADLGFAHLLEKNVATVPEAARPLNEGLSGLLWNSARILTAASLVLALVPGSGRGVRRVAGVLGAAGSICLRFGVHYAGQSSAMNPRATFQQQRSGQGAFEVTRRSAVTGPGDIRAFIE